MKHTKPRDHDFASTLDAWQLHVFHLLALGTFDYIKWRKLLYLPSCMNCCAVDNTEKDDTDDNQQDGYLHKVSITKVPIPDYLRYVLDKEWIRRKPLYIVSVECSDLARVCQHIIRMHFPSIRYCKVSTGTLLSVPKCLIIVVMLC